VKSPQLPIPNLRPTRLDDYPQIQQLESSHDLLTLPAEDWRRMWLDNPLRARLGDNFPIGWVLEDSGGQIVGSMANIPTRYTFENRDLIAVTGRGWVVSPEYRGVALLLMDEYFNQEGADLFINTTVNSMAVDPFSAFGSARVPLGDWETAAYWITNYRGFAATALRIKHAPMPALLALPAAAALKLKDAFTVKSLPAGSPSVEVSHAAAFDSRFDAFWQELSSKNPGKLLGYRDSATLAWHFAGPLRAKQVWILTASRSGLLRGYCIVKRQDHPPSGLTRMRVVDYQSLDPQDDLLPALLGVAMRKCVAEGIHTLEHVGCDLPKMSVFDQFAPYRRKLPAWPFYYHASDEGIDSRLRSPEAWDPSTYDGDASL
jgi:hypothetical protein